MGWERYWKADWQRATRTPKEAVMLKVITYRGKEPIGRMIYMPIDELQKRTTNKEE